MKYLPSEHTIIPIYILKFVVSCVTLCAIILLNFSEIFSLNFVDFFICGKCVNLNLSIVKYAVADLVFSRHGSVKFFSLGSGSVNNSSEPHPSLYSVHR